MQGTSLAVLKARCGEMPLQLRMLKSQIEYSVKVRCSDGHVSSSVFDEHWTHHYGTYNDRNLPIAIKVDEFHDTVETNNVEAPKTGEIQPWLVVPLKTVDQLSNCINKHEQPHALLALSNDLIDTYTNSVRLYTDASKTDDNKVGVGCYPEPT